MTTTGVFDWAVFDITVFDPVDYPNYISVDFSCDIPKTISGTVGMSKSISGDITMYKVLNQ